MNSRWALCWQAGCRRIRAVSGLLAAGLCVSSIRPYPPLCCTCSVTTKALIPRECWGHGWCVVDCVAVPRADRGFIVGCLWVADCGLVVGGLWSSRVVLQRPVFLALASTWKLQAAFTGHCAYSSVYASVLSAAHASPSPPQHICL